MPLFPYAEPEDVFRLLAAASVGLAVVGVGHAVLVVSSLSRGRAVAPLIRGSLEQTCSLGAALISSIAALLWMVGLARIGGQSGGLVTLLALAHPLIAAGPWAAGEILSGPSRRGALSLLAAIAAAGGLSWLMASHDLGVQREPSHLAADALAVGLCSAGTYLAVRGPPRPQC